MVIIMTISDEEMKSIADTIKQVGISIDLQEHFMDSIQSAMDLGKFFSYLEPSLYADTIIALRDEMSIIFKNDKYPSTFFISIKSPDNRAALYELLKIHLSDSLSIKTTEEFQWLMRLLPQVQKNDYFSMAKNELTKLVKYSFDIIKIIQALEPEQKLQFLQIIKVEILAEKISCTIPVELKYGYNYAQRFPEEYALLEELLFSDKDIEKLIRDSQVRRIPTTNTASPLEKDSISMSILSGFIHALGIGAVALGFTALCAVTMGLSGVIIAGAVIATTAMTFGVSKVGFFSAKEDSRVEHLGDIEPPNNGLA